MIIKKILVPIDFNSTSERALECARTLADALGAQIHLLHVVGDPLASAATVHHEQRDACQRLEAMLTTEDRIRRRATVSCEVGTPAHEIVRYAADEGMDLVVMGTHTHAPSYQMVAGSIAEAVIGNAPCAVLAVKPEEERLQLAV